MKDTSLDCIAASSGVALYPYVVQAHIDDVCINLNAIQILAVAPVVCLVNAAFKISLLRIRR